MKTKVLITRIETAKDSKDARNQLEKNNAKKRKSFLTKAQELERAEQERIHRMRIQELALVSMVKAGEAEKHIGLYKKKFFKLKDEQE